MPKTLADEHIALVALPAPPVNPKAITVAEFNAGIRLECRIMEYTLGPADSETLEQSEFCEGSKAVVPTKSNYEGSVVVFRYLDEDGLADPANDVAWDMLKLKGTTLYLVDREGPIHDAVGAADQEYSYFEVITDHPKVPSDRGGFIRREIKLYPQKAELHQKLVA